MQYLYPDKGPRLYARARKESELLCEDASAAERDEEGAQRQGERRAAHRDRGAALRRFQQPCRKSRGGAFGACGSEGKREEPFERRRYVQVGKRLHQHEKEGDEPAHAQYGKHAALYGCGEDAVRIGVRRGGFIALVLRCGCCCLLRRGGFVLYAQGVWRRCLFQPGVRRRGFLSGVYISFFSSVCKVQCEIYAYDCKQVRGE